MMQKRMIKFKKIKQGEIEITMSPTIFKALSFLHLVEPTNWQPRYRQK